MGLIKPLKAIHINRRPVNSRSIHAVIVSSKLNGDVGLVPSLKFFCSHQQLNNQNSRRAGIPFALTLRVCSFNDGIHCDIWLCFPNSQVIISHCSRITPLEVPPKNVSAEHHNLGWWFDWAFLNFSFGQKISQSSNLSLREATTTGGVGSI